MSNQLSIFSFEDHQVRTLLINNEPWFIAVDVCKALNIKNVTQAIERLDDDERAMFNIGLKNQNLIDCRVQEINIINESGLFTLILRCRDAVNKGTIPYRFRKWVTSEVLPSIRKTGRYEIQSQIPQTEEYRYHIEITITDRLFGNNKAVIKNEAKDLNCMVTGFAKTLGFKINSMSIADEAFKDFYNTSLR